MEFFFELIDPRNFLGLPGLKKRLRKVQGSILSSLSTDLFTLYENKPAVKIFFWSTVVTSGLTILAWIIYLLWKAVRDIVLRCKYSKLRQKPKKATRKASWVYGCTLKKTLNTRDILQLLVQDFLIYMNIENNLTMRGIEKHNDYKEVLDRMKTYLNIVDSPKVHSGTDTKPGAPSAPQEHFRDPAEGAS